MAIEDYYGDITLTQVTTSENSYGAVVESETTTTIQGLINQAGAGEIEYANARNIEVDHKAYVEVTATTESIKKDDKLDGYRVVTIPKNTVYRDHHLKILLKELV